MLVQNCQDFRLRSDKRDYHKLSDTNSLIVSNHRAMTYDIIPDQSGVQAPECYAVINIEHCRSAFRKWKSP